MQSSLRLAAAPPSLLLCLLATICGVVPAGADPWDTRLSYCNDTYFGSDGGGITGCLDAAAQFGASSAGIGITGVTPELRVAKPGGDPLDSLARITAWYGRGFDGQSFDYGLAGRVGLEGGVADDIGNQLRKTVHEWAGIGRKQLESTRPTTLIGGLSGWLRRDLELGGPGLPLAFTPYGFGAAGNDAIEAGAGLMVAIQPPLEQPFRLVLPQNGAYATDFGGDGLAVFGDVKLVAQDTLYGDHARPVVAEAGAAAQATIGERAVLGMFGSCASRPYEGDIKPDCRATVQIGIHR